MNVKLPKIISSGMIIEKTARIWGTADDCEAAETSVEISFCGKKYYADIQDGKWEAVILSNDYGGPYDMTIGDITLSDIFVGRVFMLGGQSNMEMPVSRVRLKYDDDFKGLTHNPRIRAFLVERDYEFHAPRSDCKGSWRSVSPETVDNFFAVSFYLSRILEKALDIPIGLIECAVGGSRIESWMNEAETVFHGYTAELLRLCKHEGFVELITREDEKRVNEWKQNVLDNDQGLADKYFSDDYDDMGWKTRNLTKDWEEDIGLFFGSTWFRKTFEIGDEMANSPARLLLGTISDSDTVYLNGVIVGQTWYKYPPRAYDIPQGVLRSGRNTVAVRVVSEREYGGFTAGKEYKLKTAAGEISLDGDWAYRHGYETCELPPATQFVNYPSGLYNAMLAPIMPFSISAFLWYQGESNSSSPYIYDKLLAEFLSYIRAKHRKELPFVVVQLPNYDAGALNDNWRIVREKQATILNYPNTAMIVTTDIGEDNDLHPLNKKELSNRLAEATLYLLRGDTIKTVDKVKILPSTS
ncbi:MAG: sialate O-acetylesterase [Oscillospiraceae bacterium]|nr:sialate O-acetylesterase [Oscillospiraceae bacterium]